MSTVIWDQPGERKYQSGVDHGVLYLADGSGVVWDGLISVTEILSGGSEPVYLDGIKYLDTEIINDFSATVSAFTYPEEFEPYIGIAEMETGFFIYDQNLKPFGMSYRTKIGSDQDPDLGYKLHILYNLVAVDTGRTFVSRSEQIEPTIFGWTLHATPEQVEGFRATAHIVIDSTEIEDYILSGIEDILYGSDEYSPRLPSIGEFLGLAGIITITDNGDGTWTANGPDILLEMLDPTTFHIHQANAEFLDEDTYTLSTTET